MKRIHFDVEEDGFYGAYWACKDTHTAAGTDSIETVPAILCYIIFSNVCSIPTLSRTFAVASFQLVLVWSSASTALSPNPAAHLHVGV